LHALNLHWDEGPDIGGAYGPYKKSERLEIYRGWAQKLGDAGWAYPFYHTQEELGAERGVARAEQRPYIYSGACRNPETRERLSQEAHRSPSLRFRIPSDRGTILVQDRIRGEVAFDSALIGDFVIMKSNGTPSYNFAVVVDDILMRIS